MLYLTRKVGESVMINGDIEVTVTEVRGRSVRLGFTFPQSATVLRREIFDRIEEENRAAADAGATLMQSFGSPAEASPAGARGSAGEAEKEPGGEPDDGGEDGAASNEGDRGTSPQKAQRR